MARFAIPLQRKNLNSLPLFLHGYAKLHQHSQYYFPYWARANLFQNILMAMIRGDNVKSTFPTKQKPRINSLKVGFCAHDSTYFFNKFVSTSRIENENITTVFPSIKASLHQNNSKFAPIKSCGAEIFMRQLGRNGEEVIKTSTGWLRVFIKA